LDSSFLFFLFLAFAIILLLVIGLVLLLPKLLKNISGRGSGWSRLAEHFSASSRPAGDLFKGQTIEVGRVAYKRCALVGISAQGLYLEVDLPLFSRLIPLLIPWNRVIRIREGSLYWRKTAILSIGEPEIGTITLFMDLFDQARPFIASGIA
jgi:hypothetical protein